MKDMRFAVIEYTTKNGRIWKPTPERPNYLADPQKEIDPTSFACYTTALNGEHIPLVGMILGPVNKRTSLGKYVYRIIKKATGSWPQWYSLDYLKPFDILLVVHQLSNAHEITAFTKRLKQEYPAKIIIGVPTQPFGILKQEWDKNSETLSEIQRFMHECSVFVTVVKDTKAEWQSLTKTDVVYLPQPYPVDYAVKYFTPLEQKEKTIFVAGVTERDNIRKGQLVAVALQKQFPEYTIEVTDTPGLKLDTSSLTGSRFKIRPFQEWREHLQYLKKVKLVINTDYTLTRGRVQVDCAAVGTVSVGADSDGQIDLFPGLSSSPQSSIAELVAQGREVLKNDDLYRQYSKKAFERLPFYNYELSGQRLLKLASQYA